MIKIYLKPKDITVFNSIDEMCTLHSYISVAIGVSRFLLVKIGGIYRGVNTSGYVTLIGDGYVTNSGNDETIRCEMAFYAFSDKDELLEWMKGGEW